MLPTREEALKLIRDGLLFNQGPWGKHCLTAAHCAEKIASACGDMDVEKAYILGLLHDIGRKFGVRHLGHVYDGYVYMKSLGYDEVAKICLTHTSSGGKDRGRRPVCFCSGKRRLRRKAAHKIGLCRFD